MYSCCLQSLVIFAKDLPVGHKPSNPKENENSDFNNIKVIKKEVKNKLPRTGTGPVYMCTLSREEHYNAEQLNALMNRKILEQRRKFFDKKEDF